MDVNKQFNFHWNCSALIGFYCIAGCSISALRLKDISIKTNQSFSSGSNVHEMGTSQINWTHPLWYQNVDLKYNLLNHFAPNGSLKLIIFFFINNCKEKTHKSLSMNYYLLEILGETFRHLELLNWFLNWLNISQFISSTKNLSKTLDNS